MIHGFHFGPTKEQMLGMANSSFKFVQLENIVLGGYPTMAVMMMPNSDSSLFFWSLFNSWDDSWISLGLMDGGSVALSIGEKRFCGKWYLLLSLDIWRKRTIRIFKDSALSQSLFIARIISLVSKFQNMKSYFI